MAYPSAPWVQQGYALQTLQLIDIKRVRPLIPAELEIVSVLPGKTLGGIYLSYYDRDSMLEYSELIVNAALVRYAGRMGGWVSHIYVDNPDSVAGGREIWGLPKELAEFTWEKDSPTIAGYQNGVIVRQGERTLCRLSYNQPSFGLPMPMPFGGDVFSTQSSSILLFKGELDGRVSLAGSKLHVPTESPFANLDLTQPWLTAYCDRLRLVAGVPTVVGQRAVEFSYR